MADDSSIIIKKVKKGGHGHHGGAWKVAYADFVTAMMAFFLLLWLLSATSESQKEGIAEYFTPTIGLKDSMGIGFDGGEAPVEDGKSKSELMPPGIVTGQVQPGEIPEEPTPAMIESEAEANLFEKAEAEMRQAIESDPNLREFTENIIMEQTPEGLKIELRDDDKHPMFEPGSTKLSAFGEKVLAAMAPVIKKMPNHLSLTGHTDSSPFGKRLDYTNWELSADRANSARRFLLNQSLEDVRFAKVVGRAAHELLLPEDPTSPRNRRIEIVLLRGSHLAIQSEYQAAPRSLLSAPRASDTLKRYQKQQEKVQSQQGAATPAAANPLNPVLPPAVSAASPAAPKADAPAAP